MADDDDVSQATNDAYTGMLSISLLALIGGGVLLYLDFQQYPDKNPPALPPRPAMVTTPGAPPANPVNPPPVNPPVNPPAEPPPPPPPAEPKQVEPPAEPKAEPKVEPKVEPKEEVK